MIDHAFNKFVRDDGNSIEAALIKGNYACNVHPKVISGEISEDEALLQFLSNFGDRDNNGRIHRDEWCKYWEGVSASVADDSHFVNLMCQVWKL